MYLCVCMCWFGVSKNHVRLSIQSANKWWWSVAVVCIQPGSSIFSFDEQRYQHASSRQYILFVLLVRKLAVDTRIHTYNHTRTRILWIRNIHVSTRMHTICTHIHRKMRPFVSHPYEQQPKAKQNFQRQQNSVSYTERKTAAHKLHNTHKHTHTHGHTNTRAYDTMMETPHACWFFIPFSLSQIEAVQSCFRSFSPVLLQNSTLDRMENEIRANAFSLNPLWEFHSFMWLYVL